MGPGEGSAAAAGQGGPVTVTPEGVLRDWVVIGPFPNPREQGTPDRKSFDTDYLAGIGGEARARLTPTTEVAIAGPAGESVRLAAKSVKLAGPVLDFVEHYKDSDHKLAYAYTEVAASRDGEVLFLVGSDDGAKVWVNGKKVFEVLPPTGRPLTPKQDRLKVKLRKGANGILVKVENGLGQWSLSLEAYGTAAAREIEARQELERRTREFQDQAVVPAPTFPGYVFHVSEGFPRLIWRDADRVRELAGDIPLKVRWFDGDLNEVKAPTKPGRYAAFVQGKLRDGTPVKRAMTFLCLPDDANYQWADYGLHPPYPGAPIDATVWKERAATIDQWAGGLFRESLASTGAGAMLLAWLYELKPGGSASDPMESPEVANDELHLRLKLKLAGLGDKVRPLELPAARAGAPAAELRAGTPAEAGVKPDAKRKIDAACRKWAEDSREPFTVLVARNGVLVTHEAFGKGADGAPLGLDFRNEVASITKALTGMLFSQFVDQDLVAIDDPVGRVLPGFPTTGKRALTFRHLFTHTSGLEGHGNWGGIHNPYLDNIILDGLPALHPGETHNYNGMGYDLAGKAMETLTGKSVARLMHDDLFVPLGLGDVPPVEDLAYGARLTAHDLGVLAQWLANRGSYGDKRFISEETFAELLPEHLSRYWPAISVDWGIGVTPYTERKTGAPANSTDPADLLFGEHVIGHGSATSCILRVALDKNLVVVQVRRAAGQRYDEHLHAFLEAVAESLM
jgi:CubicO group peptidase (beta-lactamase class C family)